MSYIQSRNQLWDHELKIIVIKFIAGPQICLKTRKLSTNLIFVSSGV